MVLTSDQDGILLLTLNRPERLNAITAAMCSALVEQFDRASEAGDIRGVIVNGSGRAFCAGVDLRELEEARQSEAAMRQMLDVVQSLTRAVYRSRKPIAFALHGYAVGMGLELPLCGDVRIAHPETKFAFPEHLRGVDVTNAASWTLPRIVGADVASELVQTSRQIDTMEAVALGLVDAIADDPVESARNAISAHPKLNPLKSLAAAELDRILDLESQRVLELSGLP